MLKPMRDKDTIAIVKSLPKVAAFLKSISRNSISSGKMYLTGLVYFQTFLSNEFPRQSIEEILLSISEQKIDLYKLFDGFAAFLLSHKLSVSSIKLYVVALRSYFAYYDIDVVPSKFKRKVKMPKAYKEDEEALDVQDIRNILLVCNNRRLKAYILVLASGGFRAVEALAIRLKDIDFSSSPTKIHVRKEFSKTRVSRDVYISDEATKFLNDWIKWKYRDKGNKWTKTPALDDLVFRAYSATYDSNPRYIYFKIISEFQKLLSIAGLDERKEDGLGRRRKITLHSLRRFVKTVISDQVGQDYSEWFLGHSKSPYYTKKEPDRRQIYATKCMKYLTFLDYSTLEATGKNIESILTEKEQEIQTLRQNDAMNTDAISALSDQLSIVMKEIELLKKMNT
jgi:integrase